MTLQGLWSREQADDYGFIHTTPKQPIKRVKVLVAQLCPTLCNPVDCSPASLLCPWDTQGKEMGCYFLLLGIFLTQGLNAGLLHCRQILYHLSHQGIERVHSVKQMNK